ncbi:uncharacterized protein VTP21DRAFT_10554 [Calcarisporiella thermophila]|uniref:uncharacterized protein n=1 Tax=Calcarisporiella thermophila TaxID=911321 RepID=UPI0037427ADD
MALKYELETWQEAVDAFDSEDYEKSIEMFKDIAESSKIYFNIGMVFANVSQQQEAILWFDKAVELDRYLAIAYFQRGVSNFLLGNMAEAEGDFNTTLQNLRGNQVIDYTQIGLQHKLFSCEVLFNRGLAKLYLGNLDSGMEDLKYAQMNKQAESHDVIDEAISVQGEGFTVFSIPPGVLYRPPESKVKNAKKVDYLGNARVIASLEDGDTFTGFKAAKMIDEKNGKAGKQESGRTKEGESNGGAFGKQAVLPPKDERAMALIERDGKVDTSKLMRANTVRNASPALSRQNTLGSLARQNTVTGATLARQNTFAGNTSPPLSRQNSNASTPMLRRQNTTAPPRRMNGGLVRNNTFSPGSGNVRGLGLTLMRSDQEVPVGPPQGSRMVTSPELYNEPSSDPAAYIDAYGEYPDGGGGYSSPYPQQGSGDYYPPMRPQGGGYSPRQPPMQGFRPAPSRFNTAPPPLDVVMVRGGSAPTSPDSSMMDMRPYGVDQQLYADRQRNSPTPGRGFGSKPDLRREDSLSSIRTVNIQGKIKVKCYLQSQPDSARVLLLDNDVNFDELVRRVQQKFGVSTPLRLKYRDEEDELVLMTDDSDLAIARTISEAIYGDNGAGGPAKLDLFCYDA